MDVAQRGEWPVEPPLHRRREGTGRGPGASDGHRDHAEEDEHEGPPGQPPGVRLLHTVRVLLHAVRVGDLPLGGPAAEQPGQAEPGERARGEDRGDRLGQHPAALPRRVLAVGEDVGDPVVGAAQHVRHRRDGGGRGRELDVVEEGVGVPPEHDQRPQPPQAPEERTEEPPGEGASPGPPAGRREDPQRGGDEGDERDGGVDATEAGREQTRRHRGAAPVHGSGTGPHGAVGGEDQPRREGVGPHLDGDLGEHGEHPRREREHRAGQQCRHRRDPGHSPREAFGAEEGQDEQQRPPAALDHPRGQPCQVTGEEEGSHRPQVAVGLVLQLPDAGVVVPRPQRPLQVAGGRQHERGLGVRLQRPRADQPRQDGHDQRGGQALQPLPGELDRCLLPRHRRRSRRSRFHVRTSRTPGTRSSIAAASGR